MIYLIPVYKYMVHLTGNLCHRRQALETQCSPAARLGTAFSGDFTFAQADLPSYRLPSPTRLSAFSADSQGTFKAVSPSPAGLQRELERARGRATSAEGRGAVLTAPQKALLARS